MGTPQYRYLVETDTGTRHSTLYDGTDAADAMAAWSKAVSDGVEYVMLESLRVKEIPAQPAGGGLSPAEPGKGN